MKNIQACKNRLKKCQKILSNMKQKTKRRHLYPYQCKRCKKKRASLIYSRAVDGICAVCRKDIIPDNQQSLFNNYNKQYGKSKIDKLSGGSLIS